MLRLDWFGGIALAALLLFPIGGSPMTKKSREYYNMLRTSTSIPIMPPGWLFGPVWFILYLMIATAIVLWSHDANQVSWLWLAIWITSVVNFLLNKFWTLIFFSWNLIPLAAVDAVLLWATAVLVLIFMCLHDTEEPVITGNSSSFSTSFDDDLSPRRIVALVFWAVYTAWLTFAAILSIWIAVKSQSYAAVPQMAPMTNA